MVSPILEYGSKVWGHVGIKRSEIDNLAIRYFLGLHRFAPLVGLASDMGWIGVRERMIMKMCGFYNKIQKTTNDRLLKNIFFYDKNSSNNIWASKLNNF